MTTSTPLGPTCRAWLTSRLACDEITRATHESYSAHLAMFARHVGDDRELASISASDFESWLAKMTVQPSTKATRMATLRAFFAYCATPGRDLVPFDPTRLVGRPRIHKRPPKRAAASDLDRVLALADPRDRVLLVVGLQLGLRRGELAGLHVEDWDVDGRRMYVRGKGCRERWVPVPAQAHDELTNWVGVLGRRSGPMFPSSHRPGESLAPGTISHIVKQAGEACGVKLWTHLLRHTCLSDAAAQGATSWELQRQAGHAYSSTTDGYVHLRDHEVARAMEGRAYGVWRPTDPATTN